MTYQEALDYVAALAPRGWRLGLDRMREFAHRAGLDDALGGPASPQFIHVAGTNGKGSTTAYVQSILVETGYRAGAFFSPFVYDPRERIQLGRELIPEGIFAGLTSMLVPVAEEFTETDFGGISEFEFKTCMALLFYKRLQCEWVALEVGLGGRLDATNIVTPRCSVIVSIGLDHTNILGDTLEQIAQEKAGIIKPGVPVVMGQLPPGASEVIEATAQESNSPIWRYGKEVTVGHSLQDGSIQVTTPAGRHSGLQLGIPGAMQDHNMALAVAACDASGATRTLGGLQRGAAHASIPGRFEIRHRGGKTVVLDGAHNGDAARVLIESLNRYRGTGTLAPTGPAENSSTGRVLLVTGMVAGHEPREFYHWFVGVADEAFAVPVSTPRGLSAETVAQTLKQFVPKVEVFSTVDAGLSAALAAASDGDIVLVTGSFYLLGECAPFLTGTNKSL